MPPESCARPTPVSRDPRTSPAPPQPRAAPRTGPRRPARSPLLCAPPAPGPTRVRGVWTPCPRARLGRRARGLSRRPFKDPATPGAKEDARGGARRAGAGSPPASSETGAPPRPAPATGSLPRAGPDAPGVRRGDEGCAARGRGDFRAGRAGAVHARSGRGGRGRAPGAPLGPEA